jgi:hypothetical protein
VLCYDFTLFQSVSACFTRCFTTALVFILIQWTKDKKIQPKSEVQKEVVRSGFSAKGRRSVRRHKAPKILLRTPKGGRLEYIFITVKAKKILCSYWLIRLG